MNDLVKAQQEKFKRAEEINSNPQGANGDLSPEQLQEFNDCMEAVEHYGNQIKRQESLFKVADQFKESNGRISKPQSKQEQIHEDVARYSFTKAINDICDFGHVRGLEAEVNSEIARKKGKEATGFYIPMTENYTDLTTTTGAGAVQAPVLYQDFISLLRNKTFCVGTLGATMLTGLNGNVAIPRQSGAGSAYWSDGNSSTSITASNQTIDQLALTQRTLGASTTYARSFLKQANLDVENFVRQDLALVLGIELDRTIINGSGSGSVPTGILQDSGNTTVALGTNGAAPTFANMVTLETSIANFNADIGNMAYLTNPAVRGKLKSTQVASNYPVMVWNYLDNTVNGYKAYASNNVPSNLTKGSASGICSAIIFGNWNDVVVASWNAGMDVIVDPYTKAASGSGAVVVTLLSDFQIAFRHSTSFAKCVDVLTT